MWAVLSRVNRSTAAYARRARRRRNREQVPPDLYKRLLKFIRTNRQMLLDYRDHKISTSRRTARSGVGQVLGAVSKVPLVTLSIERVEDAAGLMPSRTAARISIPAPGRAARRLPASTCRRSSRCQGVGEVAHSDAGDDRRHGSGRRGETESFNTLGDFLKDLHAGTDLYRPSACRLSSATRPPPASCARPIGSLDPVGWTAEARTEQLQLSSATSSRAIPSMTNE